MRSKKSTDMQVDGGRTLQRLLRTVFLSLSEIKKKHANKDKPPTECL